MKLSDDFNGADLRNVCTEAGKIVFALLYPELETQHCNSFWTFSFPQLSRKFWIKKCFGSHAEICYKSLASIHILWNLTVLFCSWILRTTCPLFIACTNICGSVQSGYLREPCSAFGYHMTSERPHYKTIKMTWAPSEKTRISLGICPVWSESSLCIHWVANNPVSSCGQRRLWSDWADLNLRWAHCWFCWFCHAAAHLISPATWC